MCEEQVEGKDAMACSLTPEPVKNKARKALYKEQEGLFDYLNSVDISVLSGAVQQS